MVDHAGDGDRHRPVAVPPCPSFTRYVNVSVAVWPRGIACNTADPVGSYENDPSAFIVTAAPGCSFR